MQRATMNKKATALASSEQGSPGENWNELDRYKDSDLEKIRKAAEDSAETW